MFVAVVLASSRADAGHEIPFYPSFYPQEIKIEVMEPAAAARLLQKKLLHAYIGADPFAVGLVPPHVTYAASLNSYLVLTFDRPPGPLAGAGARCATAARALKALSTAKGAWTFHPYSVTPYHDDYLHHFDVVESAKKKVAAEPEASSPPLRIRAKGRLAEALVMTGGRVAPKEWDATLEEVELRDLLADRQAGLGGWLAPPWLKEGWFHAYLLHAGAMADANARRVADETFARRVRDPLGPAERANLERRFVASLARGCERVAVGYTVRHEAVNVEYSEGVENIAYDAQAGLNSPIFLRTVKLKDFPWNGWLRLGSAARPESAWNPIAGFTDPTGRLIWSAVGDPALFPAPHNGGWVPNRVRAAPAADAAAEIPSDALVFDAAGGGLRPAGRGAPAPAKVAYQVLASAFHHGPRMSPADVVYAFAFAYRWSAAQARHGNRYDPVVDRSTAMLREWLAAVKVVGVDTQIRDYGEIQLVYEVPRVDVYLKHAADMRHLVAAAPPWSATPWELTVLMEEAVTRGLAAFSEAEAKRRGVPWLDLVRDRKLKDALASLVDAFERRAFVPEPLRGLVTVEQARQRWAALKRFHRKHGHFLVTNGPYKLDKWSADSAVLGVFRDLSYPLSVGAYDQYAFPLKAFVAKAERRGDSLEIQADVEKLSKFERSFKIEREPFRPEPAGEQKRERDALVAHYAVVGGGDQIVSAGTSRELDGDRLVVDLRGKLPPGTYRVLVALALNGNLVNPEVKVLPYSVAD